MKKHRANTDDSGCLCGQKQSYANCCAPFHQGAAAPSPEALMRSRYSAYVLALEPYLLATWHASTRPAHLDLASDQKSHWLGLEIKRHSTTCGELPAQQTAIVEFVARYKVTGRACRLHEISRFLNEEGRWYYVDGEFPEKNGQP